MNNLLKVLFSACLLNPYLSFAGAEPILDEQVRGGFYIAGDIGASGFIDKEQHFSNPETHQEGAMALIGGGYLGYRTNFLTTYHLALEVFADATGSNSTITHVPFTYRQRQRYDVGVRVLPEYSFTPKTTAHVILGYTNGRFHITDNGVYGFINAGVNKSGFQTGIGFSTAFTDCLALRMDALYSIYGSQTNIGNGLTAGSVQVYRNTFSNLAGELSLVYQLS